MEEEQENGVVADDGDSVIGELRARREGFPAHSLSSLSQGLATKYQFMTYEDPDPSSPMIYDFCISDHYLILPLKFGEFPVRTMQQLDTTSA